MVRTLLGKITTLILVRHGAPFIETDNEGRQITYATDVPLVEAGNLQIEKLGGKIKALGFLPSKVFSSPSRRTQESARKFAELFGISQLVIEPELRDVEGGPTKPITYKEMEAVSGEIYPREALEALDRRAKSLIAEIITREKGETIVLFSHGDVIRVIRERFENSQGSIRPMREMSKSDYLKPGEAWILQYDENGKPLAFDFIGQTSDQPQARTYP